MYSHGSGNSFDIFNSVEIDEDGIYNDINISDLKFSKKAIKFYTFDINEYGKF